MDDPFLSDLDSLFETDLIKQEVERDYHKDLVSLGALRWRNSRVLAETPRYAQKAPKIVNVKVSPRPIQQPRQGQRGMAPEMMIVGGGAGVVTGSRRTVR
ncbi:hypothetical protein U1Q18_039658 [Sarracenia purpurea var. burkii]